MFHMPGFGQLLILAAIGLLFFGKRLPEVGRSLGKGIVEFKKGLKEVGEDIEEASNVPSDASTRMLPPAQQVPGLQPKFDPYTGKPLQPKFDPYTGKPLEETVPENQSAESRV
jgi:sec-independent protein translocase protein TatA